MIYRIQACLPLCLIAVIFTAGCGSDASGESIPDRTESGSNSEITVDDVFLSWVLSDSDIEITVSAPTTGWVAVGFEPTAAMKDADIIIGFVSADGVFIRDDWGDGFTSHRADTELGGADNVTLISGNEEDGATRLIFSIPLSSGDQYDKHLETGTTYKVLLAYGQEDADNYQGYHAWAKTVELEL